MSDEATQAENPTPGPLAQRLDHLFKTVHPKGRGPYTHAEAADKINEMAGQHVIGPTYLWQLRNGKRSDPTLSRIKAIADFFGVSVLYFSDDETARRTDEQLELAVAMRDASVRAFALRTAGLSDKSLQALQAMVENARALEGLPEVSAEDPGKTKK